jgi:glycosyltransferase involved in cell wall biosynthesis
MSKKILFVDHTPFIGGAELVLIGHIKQLIKLTRKRSWSAKALAFRAFVACSDSVPELIKNYEEAGAEVFVVPFDRLKVFDGRVFWRLFRSVSELSSVIRRHNIDLVVTNTERAMYAGTIAALVSRRPLIWWVRDFEYNRLFFRLLSFVPQKIICVSKVIREFYGGEGNSKFEVVYVASDFDEKLQGVAESEVAAIKEELGIGDDDFVVGFVGRLVEWKGSQVLLKAAGILRIENCKLKIVIVGTGEGQEGNIEPQLHQMIKEYDLQNQVALTGQRDDVPVLMNIFDVFCHSSIKPEPFATVVVEAMLAGVPVVGTRIGGTPEVIRDGENGFLVPADDPKALAEVLKRLCKDESLRRRIGAKAKETALAGYTEAIVTRRVEKIYEEVLK